MDLSRHQMSAIRSRGGGCSAGTSLPSLCSGCRASSAACSPGAAASRGLFVDISAIEVWYTFLPMLRQTTSSCVGLIRTRSGPDTPVPRRATPFERRFAVPVASLFWPGFAAHGLGISTATVRARHGQAVRPAACRSILRGCATSRSLARARDEHRPRRRHRPCSRLAILQRPELVSPGRRHVCRGHACGGVAVRAARRQAALSSPVGAESTVQPCLRHPRFRRRRRRRSDPWSRQCHSAVASVGAC